MYKLSEIKELMKLIDRSSIQSLEIEHEQGKIRIQKANPPVEVVRIAEPVAPVVASVPVSHSNVSVVAPVASIAPVTAAPVTAPESVSSTATGTVIVSPMVGTFYAAPAPEAPPFVTIGDTVQPQTIVCIVEAMKLMNEIEAEVAGTIVEVLVTNGQLVEYGQPLFRLRQP